MFQHMQKKLVAGGTASWVVIKPRVLGHDPFYVKLPENSSELTSYVASFVIYNTAVYVKLIKVRR